MLRNDLVSIIIIFLNAEDFIKESIESVLAQTYSNWELLLIDDGSTDRSSEIAKSYTNQHPDRIYYLEHDRHQNLGMSASRNLGIHQAKGDYIAFLDADDYWLPTRLETHVEILDSNPSVGMLFGSTKYWYSWTGRKADYKRDYLPNFRIKEPTIFSPPLLLPMLIEGKTEIPGICSILIRAEILDQIGGFEDSFRGMYEDQVLYSKLCLATPILATGDCLSWYRQHPNSQVSVANRFSFPIDLHLSFLFWLKTYCRAQTIKNPEVFKAIDRQLWLYSGSTLKGFLGVSPNTIRWIKKWMLRAEERFLPNALSNWLWRDT